MLHITKEQTVSLFYPLHNVLQRLGRNVFEPAITRKFFEFGHMAHQLVLVQVSAGQYVVPLVQGNTMVVGSSGQSDGLMQSFVLFGVIQLVFVGDHHRVCILDQNVSSVNG